MDCAVFDESTVEALLIEQDSESVPLTGVGAEIDSAIKGFDEFSHQTS